MGKLTERQLKYAADSRARKMAKGICSTCPNKKEPTRKNKTQCSACVAKCVAQNKKTRDYRIVNKLCTNCGHDEVVNTNSILRGIQNHRELVEKLCYKCYLRKLARLYLGGNADWQILDELFKKQKGRCTYTRLELTIGYDAQLDHRIPCLGSGRKRKTTIDNLQWLHRDINQMKGAIPEGEFIRYCNLIRLNS